jgi:uncharacterized membrane protein YccF (DUF307 family)
LAENNHAGWLVYDLGIDGTGQQHMSLLGNIVFFIFGGFVIFLGYVLGGILLCLTIVGIPFGFMCFRLAGGVIAPFGREVTETQPPGGTISLIMNIIWIILPGLELAIMHLVLALFFALTIVGLPIAAQHIKLVPLALLPFGHVMRDVD